jgi:alkylated DNA nucleotide flippase Atl1
MRHELVYTVGKGAAQPARRVTLAEAGLKERSDLQEWIRNNPAILGQDVRIITYEFDRWESGSGKQSDRLDLLGLSRDGYLVLAELKRDDAPSDIIGQSIRYAAYASRFTVETLGIYHGAYLRSFGETVDDERALGLLEDHCENGLDPDLLRSPRIVLVAGEFPEPVTASVVWLCEQGLDITLVQAAAYQSVNDLVLTVSQIWPLPEVEDFTVSPRAVETRAAVKRVRARRAVPILIESGVIADGTLLTIKPAGQWTAPVEAWLAERSGAEHAVWRTDHSPDVLEWSGKRWSTSGLAEHIVREAAPGSQPSLAGPDWWTLEDGTTLSALAGRHSTVTRDWSDLHDLLSNLEPGEWISYGRLADAIGSGAQAVGTHVSVCSICPGAWRILGADGRPREGFRWVDPNETRSQQQFLEGEGLQFTDGVADPTQAVTADELKSRPHA